MTQRFFASRRLYSPTAKLPRLLLLAAGLLVGGPAGASDDDAPGHRDFQVAVRLVEGSDVGEFNARWGTTLIASLGESNHHLLGIPEADDCEQTALLMAGDPAVASADPNWIIEGPEAVRQMVIAAVTGGWVDFEFQQMAASIGMATAHAYSQGEGVIVAVLDTGVYEGHNVFDDRLSEWGYDFIDDDDQPREENNGLDDDLDGSIDDGYGHGTMVAGLIALVAPQAQILPVRILDDEGRTDLFTMAAGVEYALAAGADVINMSFGARLQSLPGLEYLFTRCAQEGVIPVAGAGNENFQDPPLYPAQLDEVFMVTALDSLGVKADFADYNPRVLVAAPGVGLRSSYPEGEDDEEWGLGAGCSFATALVSAEVALILALDPTLTHAEVRARVAASVTDIYDLPGNVAFVGQLGTGCISLPLAVGATSTAVPGGESLPTLRLGSYPNPSRDAVHFSLPAGHGLDAAGLSIYDSAGRLVRELSVAGAASTTWDGRDRQGRRLPAGTYFARMATPTGPLRARIVLVR